MNHSPFSKSIFLVRGLPGSGKSTLAKLLSESGKYPVLSVDDYFTNEKNEYQFKPLENHLAYKQCERLCEEEMQKSTTKIFIDNTLTIDWEIETYFKLAAKYEYKVFVLTVENYHGNTNIHQIADEQIKKMAEKYKVKLY